MRRIRKFIALLESRERRRAALVTLFVAVMAGMEMLGVASVLPFLNVLANPDSVQENPWLSGAYELSGTKTTTGFLTLLALASFAVIAISAIVRVFTQHQINRFVQRQRHTLGVKLLAHYLAQPYEFFLQRHSSDLGRQILSEADVAVTQFVKPLMTLLAHGAVVGLLLVLLLLVNPLVALAAVTIIGGLYLLVFGIVRRRISRLSDIRIESNRGRFRAASDALDAIKLVKLHAQEDAFVKRFQKPSSAMAHSIALTQTLSQVPRYLIETLAIGGILLIFVAFVMLYDSKASNPVGALLPVLGLYAFAGYRILPSAQSLYAALSTMRMGGPAFDAIHRDLSENPAPSAPRAGQPLRFRESIELRDVTFRYAGATETVLDRLNLEIKAGEFIGIRGATGEGKSTLLDLLLALLPAQEGKLLVDGLPVTEQNRREWQQNVAYVPQDVVLADDSVAANIAFGDPEAEIDLARVQRAAGQALIHDFVERKMPQGYETTVGERGTRLSGGQRQRVGIARALYRNPRLLVLDEATSALDEATERRLLHNLGSMQSGVTTILVSHRQPALETCHRVLDLAGGQLQNRERSQHQAS